METKNTARQHSVLCHIKPARALAARLGKSGISARIGLPVKIVTVTETISEKTRRSFAACDDILCK